METAATEERVHPKVSQRASRHLRYVVCPPTREHALTEQGTCRPTWTCTSSSGWQIPGQIPRGPTVFSIAGNQSFWPRLQAPSCIFFDVSGTCLEAKDEILKMETFDEHCIIPGRPNAVMSSNSSPYCVFMIHVWDTCGIKASWEFCGRHGVTLCLACLWPERPRSLCPLLMSRAGGSETWSMCAWGRGRSCSTCRLRTLLLSPSSPTALEGGMALIKLLESSLLKALPFTKLLRLEISIILHSCLSGSIQNLTLLPWA